MTNRTKCARLVTHFNDFEELNFLVQGWGLDYRVLDCGRFFGQHNQVVTPEVLVSEARYNRHLIQKGNIPQGLRTFGIVAHDTTPFTWRKQEVSRNSVLVFPKGSELEATTFPGFHVYTLSLQENLLEERLQNEGHQPVLWEKLHRGGVFKVSYATMQAFRNFLKQILRRTNESPELLESIIFRQRLQDKAVDLIFEALSIGDQNRLSLPFTKHAKIVQAVDDLLADTGYTQNSVYDLACALNINERTLRRVISRWYGISSKQYLLSIRLHEVRRRILQNFDPQTTIHDIATRLGFSHMGNFAALYRRHFGELPSETQKRDRFLSNASQNRSKNYLL